MATLGQGTFFEFGGERYFVAPIGPGVRTNFSRWYKLLAWERLDEQRSIVDPARFGRMEAALTQAMTQGKYEWGSDLHAEIADTETGIAGEFIARLWQSHKAVRYELVKRIGEELGYSRLISLMNVADGVTDPNANPPPADKAPEGEESQPTKNLLEPSLSASPDSLPKKS